MEIKGVIIVSSLMSQMEVGQTGYLTTEAITIMNGCEMFINTGSSISQVKNKTTLHTLPITRTGPGKEDFEIDFHISQYFINNEVDEETKKKYQLNPKLIGPFPIEVEIYRALSYREQLYPRMDLTELIEDLILTNQYLETSPDNEIYIEDKKVLRNFIREKLKEVDLDTLIIYQKTFSPLSEEESQDGEMVNYAEDEKILKFVIRRMEELQINQQLERMSLEKLHRELELSNRNEDFERSGILRDIIRQKEQ